MTKMIMKQESFKSGLLSAMEILDVFGTLSVDPSALNTTRSHISMWNKDNPSGPQYKVLRIDDSVRVLRIK
jgi:hypothetical protein